MVWSGRRALPGAGGRMLVRCWSGSFLWGSRWWADGREREILGWSTDFSVWALIFISTLSCAWVQTSAQRCPSLVQGFWHGKHRLCRGATGQRAGKVGQQTSFSRRDLPFEGRNNSTKHLLGVGRAASNSSPSFSSRSPATQAVVGSKYWQNCLSEWMENHVWIFWGGRATLHYI